MTTERMASPLEIEVAKADGYRVQRHTNSTCTGFYYSLYDFSGNWVRDASTEDEAWEAAPHYLRDGNASQKLQARHGISVLLHSFPAVVVNASMRRDTRVFRALQEGHSEESLREAICRVLLDATSQRGG